MVETAASRVASLGRTGRLECDSNVRDRALGAGDPLFHRGGRHQESTGDLFHAEPGHDAKRQRNLLGCRQGGVPAHEQQPQDVVPIVTLVQAFRGRVAGGSAMASASGRDSMERLRRLASRPALRPTVMSQAVGSTGKPFCGQVCSARRHASWKNSSAVSRSRKYRSRAATALGRAAASATSMCAGSCIWCRGRSGTLMADTLATFFAAFVGHGIFPASLKLNPPQPGVFR